MQNPVKERVAKLREEIAQLNEANRVYVQSDTRSHLAISDHQRRLQRLREIREVLMSLTTWKKT